MRVKVRSKVIPASFLKVEGKGDARWGERLEREGQIKELVGDQNPGPEAPPMSKKGSERGGSKGDVRRGAMEKSTYVRVIEGRRSEEMTQLNTFCPRGSEASFESQRG